MLAAFPDWNPDAATTMIWFDEIPKEATEDQFKNTVRRLAGFSSSTKPPNIFQIVKEIQGDLRPEWQKTPQYDKYGNIIKPKEAEGG